MNDVAQKIMIGIGTGTGVGLLGWLAKRYLKPMGVFFAALSTLMDDVSTIKSEVLSNGGGSLKDTVVAIGDSMAIVEARQRGLISTLARATFETDSSFNWTEGNMAVERLTGYGFSHLERRQWKSRIHEDDRQAVMDEIGHAVKDKRAATVSFRFVNQQGEDIPVRLEATPTFSRTKKTGEDGPAVICWFGSLERTGPMDGDQRHGDRRHDERRQSA